MPRHSKKNPKKVGQTTGKIMLRPGSAPNAREITALVALFNTGRYAEGERLARKLTMHFPQHGFGWKVLGGLLQAQGRAEEALTPMKKAVRLLPDDPETHNNLGSTLLAQHRHTEAEACFRQALVLRPNYPEAHDNLGNTVQKLGRYTEAEACFRQALAIQPNYVRAHNNLALLLQEQGRLTEAEASYRRALVLQPDLAETHNNLGNILNDQDRFTEAEASYRQALALQPHLIEVHNNLGNALQKQNRLTEAEACFRQALALRLNDPEAHNNLGNILQKQGRLVEAEASLRHALVLQPTYAEAHHNLGIVLQSQGRLIEAEVSYRRALAIQPDLVKTYNNLGNTLCDQGRLAEAEASLRHALAIQPNYAEAHSNLGIVLQNQGRLAEAEASLRHTLVLQPNLVEAYSNLGAILNDQGRLAEAEASLRHALALQPDCAKAHSNLGNTFGYQGRLAEAEASYRAALAIQPDLVEAHGSLLFTQNYSAAYTPVQSLEDACRYGRLVARKVTTRFTDWICPISPECLRIGLVSGDLRNHPVGYFLESLLACINPASIELIAYPTYPQEDDLTARLRPSFTAWKPLFGLSDRDAAHLIHADGVHILIDLSGYTRHSRLPMFAWKPAPVQVSWLGYFATTGMMEMDYLLGDKYVAPPEEEAHFTETLWRLPDSYLCFTPPAVNVAVAPLPAQSVNGITFGSFNNLAKMNDQVVALWARVLQAIPGSRLLLKTKQLDDPTRCEITRQRFAAQGITPDRLLLEGSAPRIELLAAYHRVDIALDPFPYPGGVTSLEALWMGVPVLTRRGDRFLSHIGESIAQNVGLPDWIADDDDDYVAKAMTHTAHLKWLSALRERLRLQVLTSPLFDAPRFAQHFESALWSMWQRWQEPPKLHSQGQVEEALMSTQKVAQQFLEDAKAHNNLGNIFLAQGRLAEAEASLRQALALRSDLAEAHNTLGNIFLAQDRLTEAEDSYRAALTIQPNLVEAHNNLGSLLNDQGRLAEAEASLRQALALRPDFAKAHHNLGNTFMSLGRLAEAEASLRQAIHIDPYYAPAHFTLGYALGQQGYYEQALAKFQWVIDWAPNADTVQHAQWHQAMMHPVIAASHQQIVQARTRTLEQLQALLRSGIQLSPHQAFFATPFYLAYQGMNNCDLQRVIGQFLRLSCPDIQSPPPPRVPRAKGRIQIGICSSLLLHRHTIGKLYVGLIEYLNRDRFELWLLRPVGNEQDALIDSKADHVIPLSSNWSQAQQQIAEHTFDILFYPDIGMSPFSCYLSFQRLAPVQCVSWGHPDTTGSPVMDYYLSSVLIEADDADNHYTEQLIRLRHLPTYYYRPRPEEPQPDRSSLGLPETATLYVCPQVLFKFHPDFDPVLAELLRRDPQGVLVLICGTVPRWSELLLERLAKNFPDITDRVLFLPRLSRMDFCALLFHADVIIDPPHFGGGNSSYEALAMLAPIVTWPGPFMRGRITTGAYLTMGFTDLIAHDADHYLQLAYRVANNLEFRQYCREQIQQRASVLYENMAAVREIERFFIAAVEAARRGERVTRWPLETEVCA